MCGCCGILHFHDRFRSSLQYFHEIDKIRSLVSRGDMAADSESVPLSSVTAGARGYIRHELRCTQCGQRFAVWLDEDGGGLKAI